MSVTIFGVVPSLIFAYVILTGVCLMCTSNHISWKHTDQYAKVCLEDCSLPSKFFFDALIELL